MFSTPDFWVCIAFLLFLALFGKKGIVRLAQLLEEHRQKIAHQIEEAERLHDEALSLLNSYKKKHEKALEQARDIKTLSKKEAIAFQKSSELEFEKLLANKEKALLERIALETDSAKTTLKNQAADEALAIVERVLSKDLKEKQALTKMSLKNIAGLRLKGE